jgi:hypothetical protein
VEETYRHNEWVVMRGLQSELRRVTEVVKSLKQLRARATAALTEMPWASDVIAREVEEAMRRIAPPKSGANAERSGAPADEDAA